MIQYAIINIFSYTARVLQYTICHIIIIISIIIYNNNDVHSNNNFNDDDAYLRDIFASREDKTQQYRPYKHLATINYVKFKCKTLERRVH